MSPVIENLGMGLDSDLDLRKDEENEELTIDEKVEFEASKRNGILDGLRMEERPPPPRSNCQVFGKHCCEEVRNI